MTPQHLFSWIRPAKDGKFALPAETAPAFVPVVVEATEPKKAPPRRALGLHRDLDRRRQGSGAGRCEGPHGRSGFAGGTAHSGVSGGMLSACHALEVVDTGRRRRWSDDEKRRTVEESHSGPRQVSSTARRHGISNALMFAWRKAYREKGGWARFVVSCRRSSRPKKLSMSHWKRRGSHHPTRRLITHVAGGW
jgi:transposase